MKLLFDLSSKNSSSQIMRSLEWSQQVEDLIGFEWREQQPVPACRGGQAVRFQVFADCPNLSDYDLGKRFALNKAVFQVDHNAMLESGMIEVRATSVGLLADMPA